MTITPKDGTKWKDGGGGFIADSAKCEDTALVFCRIDAQQTSETLPATNAATSTTAGTKYINQIDFDVIPDKSEIYDKCLEL